MRYEKITIFEPNAEIIFDIECEQMKENEFFSITIERTGQPTRKTFYQVHNFKSESDYLFSSNDLSQMSDKAQETFKN